MTDSLKTLIDLGRPYLRQYLEEHGIDIVKGGQTKFFSCIHPNHEDKNPSANLMKNADEEMFHCFSCQVSGDIYQAAHYIEDKPLYGLGFIKENLEYILDKYAIDYDKIEFTEEQLSNLKYDTIYNSAAAMLTQIDPSSGAFKYSDPTLPQERGWGESICKDIGVGVVKDYKEFVADLAHKTSISQQNLVRMGITKDLFGPDLITFTVRNEKGNVKGFAARYTKWKKNSAHAKYRNTSMEANPFYRKDRLLFCLDRAKKYKDMRLDIFEGYGSAVTAQQAGHKNCCAMGGTALTEDHIDLIRNLGFHHVNLVLDSDKTGVDKMDNYIDKFSGYNGLTVTLTRLPFSEEDKKIPGANDPDYFIQKYGLESYKSVRPITMFQHMLEKTSQFEEEDPLAAAFCKKIIPLIINEPDMIKRGQMITALANHTHIDKDDIKAEIQRLEKTDIKGIKNNLARKLQNASSPDQIQTILSSSLNDIQDTSTTKQDRYRMSVSETIEVFDEIFIEMNKAPEGLHGWITGYEALDNLLDGIPRPGVNGGRAIGFAGAPQAAKSATLMNIVLRVALNNDNVSCLYWAIDDHRKAIAYRLVAMLSGVSVRKVMNTDRRTPEEIKAIKEAQTLIKDLISDRKMIFKDDRYGRSRHKAEAWIQNTQNETGNEILFCVDSMHNVQGADGEETRIKLLNTSTWLKSLTASVPCTVLATLELVKNREGKKPTLKEISECVTGDALITMEDSSLIPITEINAGDRVLSMSPTGKLESKKVTKFHNNGLKKILKIETDSGKEISVTENHPLWTIDGWKEAKYITENDYIASSRLGSRDSKRYYDPRLSKFLGYMAGDGSYRHGSCISFINNDKDIINDITDIIKEKFNMLPKVYHNKNSIELYWTTDRGKENPLIDYFNNLNLRGQIEYNKKIPHYLLSASREDNIQYLSGLLLTDRYISRASSNAQQTNVCWCTTSILLAKGIQNILHRLGYLSQVKTEKINGKMKRLGYRVSLCHDDIFNFLSEADLVGRKNIIRINVLSETPLNSCRSSMGYKFPPKITQIIRHKRLENNISVRTNSNWWPQKSREGYKRASSECLLENSLELQDINLYELSQSEICWEQVKKIERMPEELTFCLSVEDNHNFITNSFISHNSGKMEYDFDTVAVVWNEAQGKYCPVDQVNAKWGYEGNWKPVIELDFQKNKAGAGEKGAVYMKFEPSTTAFVGSSTEKEFIVPDKEVTMEGKNGSKFTFSRNDIKEAKERLEAFETGW